MNKPIPIPNVADCKFEYVFHDYGYVLFASCEWAGDATNPKRRTFISWHIDKPHELPDGKTLSMLYNQAYRRLRANIGYYNMTLEEANDR